MLHSWTGIGISGLVGTQINSPENGIYMNEIDHSQFGSFLFYFEKDEVRECLTDRHLKSNLYFPVPRYPQQV